jgi:hypothetical protein
VLLCYNPMIRNEWRKDEIVITTNGTYPSLFVTKIFRNGQPMNFSNMPTVSIRL